MLDTFFEEYQFKERQIISLLGEPTCLCGHTWVDYARSLVVSKAGNR
jgi:hypothetical protein